MKEISVSTILLFAAVSINSALVYYQKNIKIYNVINKKHGLLVHGLIILPLWFSYFGYLTYKALGNDLSASSVYIILGTIWLVTAIYLVAASIKKLGLGSLVNAGYRQYRGAF